MLITAGESLGMMVAGADLPLKPAERFGMHGNGVDGKIGL